MVAISKRYPKVHQKIFSLPILEDKFMYVYIRYVTGHLTSSGPRCSQQLCGCCYWPKGMTASSVNRVPRFSKVKALVVSLVNTVRKRLKFTLAFEK